MSCTFITIRHIEVLKLCTIALMFVKKEVKLNNYISIIEFKSLNILNYFDLHPSTCVMTNFEIQQI